MLHKAKKSHAKVQLGDGSDQKKRLQIWLQFIEADINTLAIGRKRNRRLEASICKTIQYHKVQEVNLRALGREM